MNPRLTGLLSLFGAVCAIGLAVLAEAQIELNLGLELELSAKENEAFALTQANKLVKAREIAEQVIAEQPDSIVGHYVLGHAHHYGEANFPKALYYLDHAEKLFTQQFGPDPTPTGPWRWHARLLHGLAAIHGDLEHYEERLRYIHTFNELYFPKMLADRAWPLMKMGRYAEARLAAQEGLAAADPRQHEIALNALCAVEFEAGNDGASYDACREALDFARDQGRAPQAVDLTNFAEAARSMLRLDQAEQVLIEATRATAAWYGNPWMELAELYTRGGRYAEALNALKEVPKYRAQRPPHVRDADRNEARRALSAFFVVIGRPDDALRITSKALVMPDRRSHNSRDPAQDRAITALLDRRSHLLKAEMVRERAAALPWYRRLAAYAESTQHRFRAWMSARQAGRLLTTHDRLVGTYRIGTAKSAVMPPWLIGDLVEILGAGVVRSAITQARAIDERPGAGALYDAFEAEADLAAGELEDAVRRAEAALGQLSPGDTLLAARTRAVRAEAARRLGTESRAVLYDVPLQRDPGVFRRLQWTIPVRIGSVQGDDVAEEVADAILRSPRFEESEDGLVVQVNASAASGRACLLGVGGSVVGCGEAEPKPQDDVDVFAQRIVDAFHEGVFSPRVDLTQADANSLDGSHSIDRNPLRTIFGEWETDLEE